MVKALIMQLYDYVYLFPYMILALRTGFLDNLAVTFINMFIIHTKHFSQLFFLRRQKGGKC